MTRVQGEFFGFRSQCMMPSVCSTASASRICSAGVIYAMNPQQCMMASECSTTRMCRLSKR